MMEFNFGAVEKINLSQVERRQKGGKIEIIILLFFIESFGKYIIWILCLWEAFVYTLCLCVCVWILNVSVLLVSTNNFNKRYLSFWRGIGILLSNILPSFLHVIKQRSKNTNPRKKKSSCPRCCRCLPLLYPHQLFD